MQILNQQTEKCLAGRSPNAVHVTVGKYEIPRWRIEDSERVSDPLLNYMRRDGWDEKQAWLDSQGVPHEILTHSHYSLEQEAAVIHVILLTESENATMFALRFGNNGHS
jgi:hypothetical protein